jgi:hypothetical protein
MNKSTIMNNFDYKMMRAEEEKVPKIPKIET